MRPRPAWVVVPVGDLPSVPAGPESLDASLSWEGLAAAGGGLGAAGFIVLDDQVDIVAVAHGVSRFLSVESCGQCTPCKQDGLAMTEILDRLRRSAPEADDLDTLPGSTAQVTDGARRYLAQQHQNVVESLLARLPRGWRPTPTGACPRRRPSRSCR